MPRNPRHDKILNLLQNLRQVTVTELTDRLNVSQVTIRKDLTMLEEQGFVLRSHGGARLAQDVNGIPSVSSRSASNSDIKQRIATRAIELVQDGDSLCIDAGSTNLVLSQSLSQLTIRVVTNSLEIINTLADSTEVSLTALAGNFRREASSFIGPLTELSIAQMQFDIAFIGATGFSEDGAFFCHNSIEAQAKRAMLAAARRRVIVADSSKFMASAFAKFAMSEQIDVLITDTGFTGSREFEEKGIEVVIV